MKNKNLFLLIPLILFTFIAMKSDEIIITKQEEIKPNKGKLVTIIGTYKKLYLPIKKKRPGKEESKKEFGGRIYIELSDSTKVVIEVNEEGIRSKEEIEKFENKEVRVIGIMYGMSSLWGDGKAASIVMNCVREIKKIEILEEETNIPIITSKDQLTKWEGSEINALGTYKILSEMIYTPHSKNADGSFIYRGLQTPRAYIVFDDSTRIQLSDPTVKQNKDLENKKVKIISKVAYDNNQLCFVLTNIKKIEIIDADNTTIAGEDFLAKIANQFTPTIKNGDEITSNTFKIVKLIGKYKELNVAKSPDKVIYNGRAYIQLEDGTSIALDSQEKGIRSKEEIKKYNNKKVSVTGFLSPKTHLWGDGQEASIVMNYLSGIGKIELIEENNSIPIITKKEQLAKLKDETEIQLIGIYGRKEIKKLVPNGKNKNGSFTYEEIIHTCAYIELYDNIKIMLGIGSEVIREDYEIDTYKNKKVTIKGTYYKNGWELLGDNEYSKENTPYIQNIKNIDFADVNHLPRIISVDFISHNYTYNNLDELDSQRVQIEGIYKQEEVGKNIYHKNPNDPPHYTGHVCIQLTDSSKIFIETGKEGIRSAEEIKKFENKKVFVIGTLYKNHGLFEGPENISVTCIKKITTIELKENE